jgi:hypothetical protein
VRTAEQVERAMEGLTDEDRVRFLDDWRAFARDLGRAWEEYVMAGALGQNPAPIRLAGAVFRHANGRLVDAPTDPVSQAWARYFVGVSHAVVDDAVLEDLEHEVWGEQ